MAKVFNAREFADCAQLAAFVQAAGAAIAVQSICSASGATWVLFSVDDTGVLAAANLGTWSHQGPGRGFVQGAVDPATAYACDIKAPDDLSAAPIVDTVAEVAVPVVAIPVSDVKVGG